LEKIQICAQNSKTGVVIGGGLLGLECANALRNLHLETHVVEFAPRLMPRQLDEMGAMMLRRHIEGLGIGVHTGKSTKRIVSENGRIVQLDFTDGSSLATDLVVFSAGIRPRDELARNSGILVGDRGGIVINQQCLTSDPHIYAIGECALYNNQTFGLVAPGYDMARVVADQLTIETNPRSFNGSDMSTKLKLLGVDVASFGDAFAESEGAVDITMMDALSGT
jgi:nitrite reductase (NADH) large subunit